MTTIDFSLVMPFLSIQNKVLDPVLAGSKNISYKKSFLGIEPRTIYYINKTLIFYLTIFPSQIEKILMSLNPRVEVVDDN